MGMGPGAGGVGEVLERVMRGEEVGEGMMEGARHLAVCLSLDFSRLYANDRYRKSLPVR
jgi:hypothetical protein